MIRTTRHPVARRWTKLLYALPVAAAAPLIGLLGPTAASASGGNTAFGFNAPNIAGGSGSVFLTGGGSFNPSTGFVDSAGGFECTNTVSKGPLTGCLAGQGVRWDTASLLPNTGFTCRGESELPAVTDNNTVVLLADFYRAGDGNNESFTAKMIVSTHDLDAQDLGVQNVWVQGVGCGTAVAHFSH